MLASPRPSLRRCHLGMAVAAVSMLLLADGAAAYRVTAFGPEVFDPDTPAMDAALGISGSFVIEDFEDTQLVPGLAITYDLGDGSTPITFTTIPSLNGYSSPPWDGVRHDRRRTAVDDSLHHPLALLCEHCFRLRHA